MKKYKILKWFVLFTAVLSVCAFFIPFSDPTYYNYTNDSSHMWYPFFENSLTSNGTPLGFEFVFGKALFSHPALTTAIWLSRISFVVALVAVAVAVLPLVLKGVNGYNKKGKFHIELIISPALAFLSTLITLIAFKTGIEEIDIVFPETYTYIAFIVILVLLIPIAILAVKARADMVKAKNVPATENAEESSSANSMGEKSNNASTDGGKPLGMMKATARYNLPGFIGEICGPITGFDSLRVKRISKIKGKIVIWEAKCPDLTLEDGDIGAAKVWGLNIPTKLGSDNITYSSYIDVAIKGQINRIQIPVAKITGFSGNYMSVNASFQKGQFPFKTLPQPTAGTVPVVSGWIKDPSNPLGRDEHFGDPVCPEGYKPLIVGYFGIQPLNGSAKCRDLGLPHDLLAPPEYIMEKQIKFDSIPSTLSTPVSSSGSEAAVEVTKEITKTVSGPKIIIGRREFKKSEIEQMFAYFWVNGYNSLGFVEASEKIIGYFTDNGYIDGKTITKADITNLLSFVWVSTYNTLPYNEAAEKIVEHLTETI